MGQEADIKSFCRRCGGERSQKVLAKVPRPWSERDTPVSGGDTWSIIECLGCQTVTLSHVHWFSEDYELTDEGPEAIVHRDYYPPAPQRKMPEWGGDLFLNLKTDEHWIGGLLEDVYVAAGMKSFALAFMGTRAIVDHIVTRNAGPKPEKGSDWFIDKLNRMHAAGLITATSLDVLYAGFDAASATAHRGFKPTAEDVFLLLDITENLLEIMYINPARERRRVTAAAALKAKTPKRP